MEFDVVAEASRWPEGVMTVSLAKAADRDIAFDLEDAKADGELISLAGLWLARSAWQACRSRLLEALKSLHEKDPRQLGWPPETVCETAGLGWRGKPALRAFERLHVEGDARLFEGLVAQSGFRPTLSERQEGLLSKVMAEIDRHGMDTPGARDIADLAGLPRPGVEDILRIGLAAGDLAKVGSMYVPVRTVEEVWAATCDAFSGREFGVGEWRDALGTSRRVAVVWLEEFDVWGWTVKEGDFRRAVRRN